MQLQPGDVQMIDAHRRNRRQRQGGFVLRGSRMDSGRPLLWHVPDHHRFNGDLAELVDPGDQRERIPSQRDLANGHPGAVGVRHHDFTDTAVGQMHAHVLDGDVPARPAEKLGDLLLQPLMHATG